MDAVARQPYEKSCSRGRALSAGLPPGHATRVRGSAFPNTSYSQNVGLVNFTGAFLLLMGLVPEVGSFFATIPPSVIGGGGLVTGGLAALFLNLVLPAAAPGHAR